MVNEQVKYDFAFTGASMKYHDFMRLANYMADHDFDPDATVLDPEEIMRRSNKRTSKREFQEMIKRYRMLTTEQRRLIVDLDPNGQRQLAMIGLCKAHPFIKDFIIEAVREKFISLDFKLTDGDYQSFLNRKMELHPELEQFSDSTSKKAKQVTWRILEQAGLIDNTKDKIILPQFVNQRVMDVLLEDDANLLKIFLMTDHDIKLQRV
ncbi:DUF1819 family protein [Membranihabitans maritimus]|uniref:DUF1819 family protein n=1 Tax=Membranihabitans maritimus TaxID=2904244 RepID=UPI001F28739A|nr:DUF1819 family protein [Membranihabitans maritimus]